MRSIQHRRFVQLFCTLLLALYSWAPAQAQLADREGKASSPAVHDHDHDGIDALLREHDQVIEFTENKGQFSEGVLFKADFPMGQALVTAKGMLVKAYDPLSVSARASEGMQLEVDHQAGRPIKGITTPLKGHGWLMEFQNASPDVNIEARSQHGEVRNYFIGDKSQHATGARSFQEVWYTNMYRGIDVRYYPAEDGSLEYDIICKPGADPKQIALHFEGIRGTHLGADGTLRLPTSIGELSFPAPVVYQVINGKERSIKSRYVLSKETLGFELEDYDRTQPLVIDPIALRWATWVNTNSANDNHGHCIWVDPSDGAIYVVARVTGSTDQITTGAFNTSNNGDLDMIVGKYLEPTTVGGSGTRVWQTYLGGNGTDNPYAMEQGPDGNLYITGYTSSSNFPLLGGPAFSGSSLDQRSQATDNIYVTKINTAGNSIKSAVVGGNNDDDSFDLRTTPNGDVVVCGKTSSTNWATLYPGSGASNTNNGGTDVLVFKVNQDLSAMQWMRNYGGSGTDYAMIMLRNSTTGDLFIGGYTTSTNFPTVSPRQSTLGGSQAGFLQRLTSTGSTTWSSYYQTASSKSAMILCMEFNNSETEIYFGGTTSGLATSNVSSGSFDTSYNGGTNDLFVGRMAVDQTFVAGTYVGGSNNEVNMMGLNVDQNNDVYIFGYTNSTDFPVSATPNVPLQPSNAGNNDKVFFKLESDLSALEFSTYYGGAADDYDPVGERGIKFSNCRIYTIVTAQSNNLPLTQGALNTTKNSSTSRYEPGLVVWANPPDLLGNSITYTGTAICAGSVPGDITGSVPSYVLPTILRNNSSSAYPSFGSAATYQWQISPDSLTWTDIAGQTSQNLSGSAIGVLTETRYIRRIIGGDACILAGAADQVVTVRIMSVRATVTNVTCHGLSNGSITAIADGLAPFQYAWSNGQSSETATGLAAGHYTVTVTDANGCAADGTFTISEPSTLGGQPTVTPATCANANGGASVAASGGTSPYSYLWSTSQTGTSINGVQGGSYSVTITDAKGCQVTIPVVIPSTGVPTVNAGSNAVITCATGGQINLNGSATAGLNYNWVATNGGHIVSGGSTLNPTVDAAGTYTLTVTDPQSNCSASDAVTVTMNTTAPNASVTGGGTLNCTISSLQLDGGSTTSGATFSWTGPNGFTSTNEDISVNAAGSYMLTVTDPTNGCTSSTSATVILDDQLPGASATGGTLTCSVTSIQLMGSGNGSFAWTGPNGFTSTEQNPTVNAAGTYNLTVTGTNGCTSSTSATVILDDQLPGASATGGTLTCSVTSIQLMGTGNGSFAWTGPNGFTSTEQNPTVNAAGTYNLTVTGTNGCTSSTSVTVILDDQLPSASATGGTLTCSVTSIQLMGTGNGSFAWSGPNGFTSTEQNPTVNAAGTYNLTVTGTNGCTSSTSATVILDDQLPGASATGGTLTCSVTSIQLMGTGNGSFAWSGPNGFTSTEQNPTVNAAGTYNLTVTGTNGCTSSTSATVILDDQLPGASATGGTLTCSVTSIQLMGSGNGSFAWSGPNGFTSTEQNPTVNAAGTYNLTVTGTNGCTSSTSATVILDDQLPGASATGGTLTCSVTSIQLMGTGNGSFAWSGPNGFTSTEQNPTVNAAGTYNLTVTGTNGCTSSTSVTVILDDQLPSASATGGTLTCSVTSIQLMGTGNGSFAWSGPNGFTSTEQNPTVNAAGTYNLTVTGTNGCTSSTSATVILDDQLPGASATGGTLTCSVTSIQLMGSGNGSFAWSGPNGFTSTEQNPTVNAAGTYNLTVTGINGCTSSTSATVILDDQLPGASATGGTLTCSVTSIQLNGSGNGSFAWSGPNGFTSTEQNPTVNAAGTYNLTVTGTNGCTSSTSATVNLDDQLPGASATGGTLTCSVTSIQLMGSGNGSFAWSGPNGFTSTAQNPTVGMAGTYNLTVTGTNGCTSTASAVVEQDDEVPGASAQGGTLNCTISEIMLVGTGNGSFAWSGPNGFTSTAQNPTVGMAGTYNLTVTGANGCTSTASAMVEQDDEVPGASAQGGTLNCTISEIMLVGTGNGSFAWSGPNGFTSTAQNPTVGMAGTYNLTVTGTNGCTSTASAVVEQDDEVPGASAQGGTLNCTISEIMLVGTGNGSFAWTGPNGFTSSAQNPTVGMAGTYNLTVTGTNGCTSTASAMVEQDDEVPGASAQGGTLNCMPPPGALHDQ
ncbi:MAG: hypothetical protein IPH05_09180 [Flavobacteriales bacterium]|nr:hypothetical protein [Flavobacteriales bacterium]